MFCRGMKKKKYKISEDRILQISNDISEDMNFDTHTKSELVEVVKYFRDCLDRMIQAHAMQAGSMTVKLLRLSVDSAAMSRHTDD